MVDGGEWTTIPLGQLVNKVDESINAKKYPIFLDKTGNAATFFTYKASMKDFHKEIMKVQIGNQDAKDALEVIRKGLMLSMRNGGCFVINLGKVIPDFNGIYNSEPDMWPAKKIFHFDTWAKQDEYMKILHDGENEDVHGNPGMYERHEKFKLVILGDYQNDEETQKFLNGIPHSNLMAKFIIQ